MKLRTQSYLRSHSQKVLGSWTLVVVLLLHQDQQHQDQQHQDQQPKKQLDVENMSLVYLVKVCFGAYEDVSPEFLQLELGNRLANCLLQMTILKSIDE